MSLVLEFNNNSVKDHKFIQFTGKPISGLITEASLLLANQYLKKNWSAKTWRREKQIWRVNHKTREGEPVTSKPLNYNIISEWLRKNGTFDPDKFGLPYLECPWLDQTMEMKLNFHLSDDKGAAVGMSSGDIQKYQYGVNYPIKPILKREGHLYTSFQGQLVKRILNDREKLILESDKALTDDWVFDLRNLISNVISLMDISLTQLYIKAEYDPLVGWKFDKEKLGERYNRRLTDKFKWVYQITGNAFNIEQEKESLENLRMLRNHLMHFDPPSLVITLEEATIWLNQVIDVGRILIKLRQALKADISVQLINFILQKEAIFIPAVKGKRQPLNCKLREDYASSTWPF